MKLRLEDVAPTSVCTYVAHCGVELHSEGELLSPLSGEVRGRIWMVFTPWWIYLNVTSKSSNRTRRRRIWRRVPDSGYWRKRAIAKIERQANWLYELREKAKRDQRSR